MAQLATVVLEFYHTNIYLQACWQSPIQTITLVINLELIIYEPCDSASFEFIFKNKKQVETLKTKKSNQKVFFCRVDTRPYKIDLYLNLIKS